MKKILVIRHGALGDIILCMKPFQDIRATYPDAYITLLTAPAFAGLARKMPWFDEIIEDDRPSIVWLADWVKLGVKLATQRFDLVLDLQGKLRTAIYRNLFLAGVKSAHWKKPPQDQERIHRQQFVIERLRAAGVKDSGEVKLDWLSGSLEGLQLPERYAVFIPGSSAHRLYKRWPASYYASLARALHAKGLGIVLIGTETDADAIQSIKKEAEFALDLSGKTSLFQLASLLRGARLTVANDTGPMHLSAALGTPTLALYAHDVDPKLSGPVGPRCASLKRDDLSKLGVEEVVGALNQIILG